MLDIRRILCPIDLSETSRRALDHAASIALWYQASVTAIYVFPNMPVMDVPPLTLSDAGRASIAAAVAKFVSAVPTEVPIRTLVVEAAEIHREIHAQAEAMGADLLVMGSHGRSGFKRFVLGSVTERTLRKACCPVLIVPPAADDHDPARPIRFSRIVCCLDFSRESARTVEYALAFARESDAQVTLLHAIDIPPELAEPYPGPTVDIAQLHAAHEALCLRKMRELVPEEAKALGRVETMVREGAADHVILSVAAEQAADLIVTGVRGRGALDLAVFGSTTGRVTRAAKCPVLVVHAL